MTTRHLMCTMMTTGTGTMMVTDHCRLLRAEG
jgi:hypothetical protein